MKLGWVRRKSSSLIIALPFFLPIAAQAVDYNVTTYLGGGASICPTTLTDISSVGLTSASTYSIAADSFGNIFYVDYSLGNLCKINSNGKVIRVAGTGTSQFGPNNVQGINSSLKAPLQIATDGDGNVYIAEYATGGAIRKLSPDGVITNVFNLNNGTTYGGDGSPAINGTGGYLTAVTSSLDGEVYFFDQQYLRIRKISTNGQLSLVAGNGSSGSSGNGGLATAAPLEAGVAVAVDSRKNVYIGSNQACIRKVDAATGLISLFAGVCGSAGTSGDGFQAASATIGLPRALSIDSNDRLYISDATYHVIRTIDLNTGIIQTLAGIAGTSGFLDGLTSVARFNGVSGVAIDPQGNLYVADRTNNKIRKIAGAGPVSTLSAPSLSSSGVALFRTNYSLVASGGSNGKITFFANGKRIAGCISRSYSGTFTCEWKPSFRGSIKITAEVKSSNRSVLSAPLTFNISGRSLLR